MVFIQHPIEAFCCQNKSCQDFGLRNQGNLRFCGLSGKSKVIRMILCKNCRIRFSERKGTVFWESRLPPEKALSILDHIREGCGTRATSRLVHVSKDTVTRYALLSGSHAQKMHDQLVSFSPSNERNPTRRKMELCGEEGKND
jgi:transposase-like protein